MNNNLAVEPEVDDGYASDHVEIVGDDEKRTDPGNKKEKHRILFTRMGRAVLGSNLFNIMLKPIKFQFKPVAPISMWPYYYNYMTN